MKRWIITENGEEKQFLIKNMFVLVKTPTSLKIINDKGEKDISIKYTSARHILTGEGIFYKRNDYKIIGNCSYRIHHTCFNELIEWLKDKRETNYVL